MINLGNIGHAIIRLPHEAPESIASAWDTSANSSFYACGRTKLDPETRLYEIVHSATDNKKVRLIAGWKSPHTQLIENAEKLVSLHYFADDLSFCLTLKCGDIVIIRRKPEEHQSHVEIAGSIDAGIAAAAWSPDEELLAILTPSKSFLLMSRNYDPVYETEIGPDDLQSSKHVSVGWGTAETQFKGRRAKGLRDPTIPEKVDSGFLSLLDKGEVNISWRGDGAYVAINSIDNEKRRTIRVYTRDGKLNSVSEPVDGLEGALSWRPTGNLLASVQRLSNRVSVVFFERNGLRHGDFNLRLNADELSSWGSEIKLSWNSDSSILAVQFKDRTQLWTMKNYHYYLKKEMKNLDYEIESPLSIAWHPENPYILHKCYGGVVEVLGYFPSYTRQKISTRDNTGLVAVADGLNLKLTPLGWANVPPPMALHEVALPQGVVDVTFSPNGSKFAVLHARGISIYHYQANSQRISPPSLVQFCDFSSKDKAVRQICFRNEINIIVLETHLLTGKDLVLLTNVHLNNFDEVELNHAVPISMLHPLLNTAAVLWLDINGGIGHIIVEDGQTKQQNRGSVTKLPTRVQTIDTIAGIDQDNAEFQNCRTDLAYSNISIIALAANGNLYFVKRLQDAETTLLTKGCTSFVVSFPFLIITTASHLLKFVQLTDDLSLPSDETERNEFCRSIERGATIVTAVPQAQCLILQMPRGNLETIYPRAFVLSSIREFIITSDYQAAFSMCRKHKVDFNILFDYAPDMFLSEIPRFIKQINNSDHIDLFLSNLRDEDVCKVLYGNTTLKVLEQPENRTCETVSSKSHLNEKSQNKVNRICNALLYFFQDQDGRYLQNEITAHTCKVPPDLETALRTVSTYRGMEKGLGEKAIEHICFLADVNQLYESALGLYDLSLALAVAQKSQKDPREYMPYLQNLQGMDLRRRHFTIDDHLHRYTKALRHLHLINHFDEFAIYTENHGLYEEALALSCYEDDKTAHITRLYAAYLVRRSKFKEAGLAYEHLKDYSAASAAYKSARLWQECLSSASLIPLSRDEMVALANDLCSDLAESKDYHAAALVQLDYLISVDSAARFLCKGYRFSDAIRIVILRQRADLLVEVIDPALIEASGSMTEILADIKGQIEAQVPRIQDLRAKKAGDPVSFYAGVDMEPNDIPDNLSLAASSTIGSTLMTRYTSHSMNTAGTGVTRRTSKNKRREERKRARGKKGSIYEEEYLVASMGRLFERVNGMADDEVGPLIDALFRRGMRQRAAAVQTAMLDVTRLCQACQDQVFEVSSTVREQIRDCKEQAGTKGMRGLSGTQANYIHGAENADYRSAALNPSNDHARTAPVIKSFAKLGLLS